MTREAKKGELREIAVLEALEKLSKRPESRMDVQKMLSQLSPTGQVYAKHLVMSGPSSIVTAAKTLELKQVEVEAAIAELEAGITRIKST